MNRLIKRSAVVFFMFGFFAIFGNMAEAGFPIIIYAKGAPSTDSVVIETSINPNGSPATAWVEYGTESNLANFKETNHTAVGITAYENIAFINVVNLYPATLYYLRVVANNGESTIRSAIFALQTLPVIYTPPVETITRITTPETKNKNDTQNPSITSEQSETKNIDIFSLGANIFYNQNFLPKTIPNWIALIILILTMLVLARKVYMDKKDSLEKQDSVSRF